MYVVDAAREIDSANARALDALFEADPILVDVRPAIEALPGMTADTVLASGPPMPWPSYSGGQRVAVLGGIVYEGLARSLEDADHAVNRGDVRLDGCHDYACVGSLAGITTASMPVLVVEDARTGLRGHCTLFEGASPERLNYGMFSPTIVRNLQYLAEVIGPALAEAVRSVPGGIPLRPIIERALRQGDELHSRNTAASALFLRDMVPALLGLAPERARPLVEYLTSGDYFFLRASMAAAKCMADHMRGTTGSSLVTAMAMSCKEFGIRVAGLGDRWYRGPLPDVEASMLFNDSTADDIEVMGGESIITEVCGLGGFAQAAAFPLQSYQGGQPHDMVRRNLQMYDITAGEHPTFRIPFLKYRGSPVGIDIKRVAETGITPVMDVGIAGRRGGQIGAGVFRAPLQPFLDAWADFQRNVA